ncbi:hypothetical protein THAOC_35235 [Thalassiosira oceanica]|uniref:Uncharacterized protein n=1 Tax=Thalassiosira oceanica TaxID=159749 RepID=K0R187_THAOC|nr:hypothetical protein THAOC_35235 [Thalassiosira oceanica]|eukprot:EJK46118.1 hypothetical protein THAOC_35235 [Thalassiosira oceanica]
MNHPCPESATSVPPLTTTVFRRRRSSDPLPKLSEPRCHYAPNRASSSARRLLSVESSCTEASEFPDFGITATLAPRELQEMLELGTGSSANSDTSSDGRNGQGHVPAARASVAQPCGTQPRLLRRSALSKDSSPMTMKSRRARRVTFSSNDGAIPELIVLKDKTNHPGVGQRDKVVELRLELCNQQRLVADLQSQIQSLLQRNSAITPENVVDVSEPSHARDEQRQIDELKLELAKEWGRNVALSSLVDSLSDVEARNRKLEEENEELRRTITEIQDEMSSIRCNDAKKLTRGRTEETVLGISSSDTDCSSVCSGIFTQSADEAPCFGEREHKKKR